VTTCPPGADNRDAKKRVVAARGRAARLGVAVAQLCGSAIEVVPDWQIAACRVSLDWFCWENLQEIMVFSIKYVFFL